MSCLDQRAHACTHTRLSPKGRELNSAVPLCVCVCVCVYVRVCLRVFACLQTSAKRPKSAYLFFCSEMREEIASQGHHSLLSYAPS